MTGHRQKFAETKMTPRRPSQLLTLEAASQSAMLSRVAQHGPESWGVMKAGLRLTDQ